MSDNAAFPWLKKILFFCIDTDPPLLEGFVFRQYHELMTLMLPFLENVNYILPTSSPIYKRKLYDVSALVNGCLSSVF